MAYVAMTRGRHNNEAFLYQKLSHEADHEHAKLVTSPAIHQMRRGNKYSAEHHFKQILGNDDRPATMHAQAQRTDPGLLPEQVAEVIERHEARRRTRMAAWREHIKTAQAWQAGHQRMAAAGHVPRRRHRPRRGPRAVNGCVTVDNWRRRARALSPHRL